LLLIDDVVGDAEMLGDAARVIDVVERAAAAGFGGVGNAVLAGEARLIPELKGEADDLCAVVEAGEDRRNGGGVDSSGHGDGDGVGLRHGDGVQFYFRINWVGDGESYDWADGRVGTKCGFFAHHPRTYPKELTLSGAPGAFGAPFSQND